MPRFDRVHSNIVRDETNDRGNRLVRVRSITTLDGMVVVIAHELSSLYLGEGFVLVERDHALEFDDVCSAQSFLARHASEPCFVAEDVAQTAA